MFELPDLPYAENALEPAMGRETLHTHHKKHHAAYIEKTNKLLAESSISAASLEDVVREAHEQGEVKLFNNAAQAWNHAFFWRSLTPRPAPPEDKLKRDLASSFGSFESFRDQFIDRGKNHFASGWLWLVYDKGKLELRDLHDAHTPILDKAAAPLLTCDLWEHAYYLDHKQAREKFLETVFDKLLDWRFAASQLDAARAGNAPWRFPNPTKSAA